MIDLFAEIENAYNNKPSIFDEIGENDLIFAFFPCIYFCAFSQIAFCFSNFNYVNLTTKQKTEKIIKRSAMRERYYILLIKLVTVAIEKKIKLIIENPYTAQTYLRSNFVLPPTIIDYDRMRRGDYFVKPTAYWFINIDHTNGQSFQNNKQKKTIEKTKSSPIAGFCSEERSMISPDYARNFICDFILGQKQNNTELTLF